MPALNPTYTRSLRRNFPSKAVLAAAKGARELMNSATLRRRIVAENLKPAEGIYYYVPFPRRWEIFAIRFDEWGDDMDHTALWEELLLPHFAAEWSRALNVPAGVLERKLRLHPYGIPRGRIGRGAGRVWLVLHGGDAKGLSESKVESAFQIRRLARWERDAHEQCQQADRDAVREMLDLDETWPAVGTDYGFDE